MMPFGNMLPPVIVPSVLTAPLFFIKSLLTTTA